MVHILLADDEPLFALTTAQFLEEQGHTVLYREDGERANDDVAQGNIDLVIADLDMPGNRQLELLNHCRLHHQHIPVIVVTGRPSLPSAIESIRLGIHDYFLKPLDLDDLLHSIRRAFPSNALAQVQPHPFDELLGSSQAMCDVKQWAERIALSQATVLIRGESGTGKELLARAIHRRSRRRGGPFVTLDCTAIPEALMESALFGHVKGAFTGADRNREGLIAQAHQGTLFLDEIGELPLHLQSKLLRVLQFGSYLPIGTEREQHADIRILAATHRDLRHEVQQGNFRMDLFYRLSVLELVSPPLRSRLDDIPILVQHFLQQIAIRDQQPIRSIAPEALHLLASHTWPGNIRELQNAVERCVCLASNSQISADDILSSLPDLLTQYERNHPTQDRPQVSSTKTTVESPSLGHPAACDPNTPARTPRQTDDTPHPSDDTPHRSYISRQSEVTAHKPQGTSRPSEGTAHPHECEPIKSNNTPSISGACSSRLAEDATQACTVAAEAKNEVGGGIFEASLSLQGFRESMEREYFSQLLERHAGNIAKAAREANLSRQGFHKALTRLGLSADSFRTSE